MSTNLSLNLEFSRANLTEEEIRNAQAKITGAGIPKFAIYVPDFETIKKAGKKYKDKKNIIVEGNGGSISTLRGLQSCFESETDKNFFMLDTDDPDYIAYLRKKCSKEDTLFIVINRSGNSIQTISGYLLLKDYETIFITAQDSTLYNIGKIQNIPLYDKTSEDPQYAGRFSGITEFTLIPAAILGMDAEEIAKGAQEMYAACAPDVPFESNLALQFALHLDKLEKMSYSELFLSIYSKKAAGFFELIVQLFHESVCKDGKGQTIYGGEAPENQHHTLQRFNSGMKNAVGVFVTIDNFKNNFLIEVPEEIGHIKCRNIEIKDFTKLSAQDVIHTEFEGTWKDATGAGMPAINLNIKEISPFSAGMLIAFLQYATYYSSLLRDVNPFDQPGVEKSKEYIFQLVAEK